MAGLSVISYMMSRKFPNAKFISSLLVVADAAHRLELGAGDHQDLRQRERDALAELVGGGNRVREEPPLQRLHRVVLAVADVGIRQRGVGAALARIRIDVGEGAETAHRFRELLLERERGALLHHLLDRGFGRAEARLLQEAHRVAGRGRLGGRHAHRRRGGRGRRWRRNVWRRRCPARRYRRCLPAPAPAPTRRRRWCPRRCCRRLRRRRDSRRGRPRRRARRWCRGFELWRSYSAPLGRWTARGSGRWTVDAAGSNTGCASTPPRLARGPGPDAKVRPAMPRDRLGSPPLAGDRLLDRASFCSCPRAGRPRRRASGSLGIPVVARSARLRPDRAARGCCGWGRRAGLCRRHK